MRPSTSWAISSPNSSRTSSSDALVSSTVSWSSAAHSVSESSRMPAQIFATPIGWVMKSSPLARRWSACRSQEKRNARSTRSRSIRSTDSSAYSSTTAKRSPRRTRWSSVSLVFGPAGVCLACLSTGRCRKSVLGAFGLALARPLPPPFAAGFFFGVAARDLVAARAGGALGRRARALLGGPCRGRLRGGLLGPLAGGGLPARAGQLGHVFEFRADSSRCRRQAAATARGPRSPAVSGSSRSTRNTALTTCGLNCVPELASSSSMASSRGIASR